MKNITYEEWFEQFKPVFQSEDAQFDGYCIDDYNSPLIENCDADKIWTLITEGENMYIIEGFHFVDRMGYFITELPFEGSVIVNMNEMVTINDARSYAVEFIEDHLGISIETFEDSIVDFFNSKV